MKIIETNEPGKIQIDCSDCGTLYTVNDFRQDNFAELLQNMFESCRLCPACEDLHRKETKRAAMLEHRKQFLQHLPQRLLDAGFKQNYIADRTTGKLFRTPPVKFVAQWIWDRDMSHLLISGVTGSGKSTSAGYIAARLMLEGKSLAYYTMPDLLAQWRNARRSDRLDADSALLHRLCRSVDITIIDEVIGKAPVSESGQELLFRILEAVNNGEATARIWLMGNFYTGSIANTFADPDPVLRRLQENFVCARIDTEKHLMERLTVWNQ